MDSSHRSAIGALWETNSSTEDVQTAEPTSAEDPLFQSSPKSSVRKGADSLPGRLSGEQMAQLTGMNRDAASIRNVTVLPFVENSGEKVELKPRNETRYQRVRRLGAGAMGKVDLVRDNDIGRTVAMKYMTSRAQSPDGIARFIDEIRTIGRLEHPNIVPIHDVGVDEEGRIFFVMKHVDGETLESIIRKLDAGDPEYLDRYTIDYRIELFLGLLHALQFSHSRGIIHRDIKPANVMVGTYGEVVLMDWGLAKLRQEDGGASTESLFSTQEGIVLGTPAYMPPEQAAGRNGAIDERSDIYSTAVLFHELLAVRHYLAHCKTQQELMGSILTERFPYMRLVFIRNPKHPVPPAELLHFVAKGLAKNPADRYKNIGEMIEQLQRIRDGRCPVSCPATLAKRMLDTGGRFVNRYPKLSPFIFYPLFLLILASVVLSARHLFSG